MKEILSDELHAIFDDPNDIIRDRFPIATRKELLKKRLTNFKVNPSFKDIIPKVDISSLNTLSIDQIAKQTEQEEILALILKKKGTERTKSDFETLINFLDQTVFIPGIKKEYGNEVTNQLLKQAIFAQYKEDEDIVKFGTFFIIKFHIESLCPCYYIIISGAVKIMQSQIHIKAFPSQAEYKSFKKTNLSCIISEKIPSKEAIQTVFFIYYYC